MRGGHLRRWPRIGSLFDCFAHALQPTTLLVRARTHTQVAKMEAIYFDHWPPLRARLASHLRTHAMTSHTSPIAANSYETRIERERTLTLVLWHDV